MQPVRRGIVNAVVPLLAMLVVTSGVASPAQAAVSERIRASYFGIQLTIGRAGPASWPSFAPGAVRIAEPWSSIERTPGAYNWSSLDMKVSTVIEHGAKPLLVIHHTPRFNALDPVNASGASAPRLSAYRAFVRSLVGRYGARADYQVWNEPNVLMFYTGTTEHMARMTRIVGRTVAELAPDATVVAPSFPLRYNRVWAKRYWKERVGRRSVGAFVDAASLSVYPMIDEGPESGLKLVRWMQKKVLDTVGFDGPLWATEINYGANGLDPTPAISVRRQTAFVVRTFALHANLGADRLYWWQWEPHQTVNTELQDGQGNLTPPGIAYGVVKGWLLGTKPKGCDTATDIRTCHFRARDGIERAVVWTRSGKSRVLIAPPGSISRTRASGTTRRIEPGQRVRVGLVPVMIESTRS